MIYYRSQIKLDPRFDLLYLFTSLPSPASDAERTPELVHITETAGHEMKILVFCVALDGCMGIEEMLLVNSSPVTHAREG